MRYWRACRDFIRELRRDFHHTGALLPSSRYLARAMAAPLAGERPSARILEVGPGTGAVTSEILRNLQRDDRLDIVEINPYFIDHLAARFESESLFMSSRRKVRLINSPIEELPQDGQYDFVMSSLPMNNFPGELVRNIFKTFRRLLVPGGKISFFEYILVRQVKTPFVSRLEKKRLATVGRIVGRYVKRHQLGRRSILFNVPPAHVRYLSF